LKHSDFKDFLPVKTTADVFFAKTAISPEGDKLTMGLKTLVALVGISAFERRESSTKPVKQIRTKDSIKLTIPA